MLKKIMIRNLILLKFQDAPAGPLQRMASWKALATVLIRLLRLTCFNGSV